LIDGTVLSEITRDRKLDVATEPIRRRSGTTSRLVPP
jgi:hypothetical protein